MIDDDDFIHFQAALINHHLQRNDIEFWCEEELFLTRSRRPPPLVRPQQELMRILQTTWFFKATIKICLLLKTWLFVCLSLKVLLVSFCHFSSSFVEVSLEPVEQRAIFECSSLAKEKALFFLQKSNLKTEKKLNINSRITLHWHYTHQGSTPSANQNSSIRFNQMSVVWTSKGEGETPPFSISQEKWE